MIAGLNSVGMSEEEIYQVSVLLFASSFGCFFYI